jgi:hypothetical protein
MILAWTFWLLLLAPGAALYLRLRPAEDRVSGFETIAVGYVLSFLVMVPLCVIGYALVLPIEVFGAGVVLAIGAGFTELYRAQRRGELRLGLPREYAVAALLIGFFLLHANALGGHITNDADFHLARIRLLYDHGMSNADPITGTGFSHPYHTNLLHAFVAAGAKLTALDPIAFWLGTLPWAKLVVASAAATLCLRIGGSTLALWAVALYQLGFSLRLDWTLYPNQLAPLWLVPIGLSGCIGLFSTDRTRYHAVLIGGAAVLLGLVHGLYAGYLAVLGAATVTALAIQRVSTTRGQFARTLRLGLLAAVLLALPAPSLYVAREAHKPAQTNFDYQGGPPVSRGSKPGRWTRALKADDAGRYHLSTKRLFGGRLEQLLAVAALIALLARRRFIEAIGIAAPLATCLLLLTVPAISGFVIKSLGTAWMLERLLDVVNTQYVALVGAGLVLGIPAAARSAARYALGLIPLALAVVAAFLGSGGFNAQALTAIELNFQPWRRMKIISAKLPSIVRPDQELIRKIPAGSVVLTHPLAARQLRKLHDLKFVRASRNHTGVDDLIDRTKDMAILMNSAPNDELIGVLAKHRIVYAIQKKNHPIKWLNTQPVLGETPQIKLIKLDPKRIKQHYLRRRVVKP